VRRHPALREFSDDHHQGLVRARRLRRAAVGEGGEPVEAARAFVRFFREETEEHFEKEERVLLPVAEAAGVSPQEPNIRRMLAEHAKLRRLVRQLEGEAAAGTVRPETLREAGELLEGHIRLEERQIFPMLERRLSEQSLAGLERRVAEFGRSGGDQGGGSNP
jgi:hemerythrin-like domain-containing protein